MRDTAKHDVSPRYHKNNQASVYEFSVVYVK